MNKIASISTSFFMWMFLFFTITSAQAQFKVVLDAGHGGKDSGAYQNKVKEKDIVLDVVLRVGKILDEHKDIKQIYTRKTDVFIELKERANIANKADANLFVSVHCNSNPSPLPYGALTLVMGQGRSGLNFEVAKAENSVIFLEDNYKEQYKGFDPNKPESVIGLKILQEESLNRSVEVASNLQSIFEKELKRKNKGVHQQLLWVLDATYMPGVLVELGFISNGTEAKYLSSEKGKQEMAEALAKVIIKYKNDYFAAEQTQTITVDAENKSNVAAKKEDQEAPNKIIPKFNSEKKATAPEKKDEKTVEKPKTEPKKDTAAAPNIDTNKDTDGDGVPDITDLCVDIKGTLNGCPDTDEDGIADKDDKCPLVVGSKNNNGCPAKDTDGDGVNDDNDNCPDVKGAKDNAGCPAGPADSDGDGILDKDDKCPDAAGTADKDGCPMEILGGGKLIRSSGDSMTYFIRFDFDKANITSEAFAVMSEIVKVLKADKTLLINIDGHADNFGLEKYNMQISQDRANVARDYFQSYGIAKSRIKTAAYGSSRPYDVHQDWLNRRVEITIYKSK